MLEINTRNKLGCQGVVILDDQVAGLKGSNLLRLGRRDALTFVLALAVCLDFSLCVSYPLAILGIFILTSVGRETGPVVAREERAVSITRPGRYCVKGVEASDEKGVRQYPQVHQSYSGTYTGPGTREIRRSE